MRQDLVGCTLGNRYRIDRFIDQGGMAAVYQAFDLRQNRPLAMKLLKADLAEDVVFVRRFRREATVLQRLNHDNIVRFYTFEQFDHLACMFLEFIDGITLRRRIYDAGPPLAGDELRFWLKPICAALTYAHQQNVYHCDIKPANIMVTRRGRVVLSDFGIARTAGGTVTTISTPGTPDYMAPEQWLGYKLDARTDIYALGITLFGMVTGGERPFTGDSPGAEGTRPARVQWEHLNQSPPSPQRYNPALSDDVAGLILRTLAKDPTDRFPTVQALDEAFDTALTDQPISSYPSCPLPEPSYVETTTDPILPAHLDSYIEESSLPSVNASHFQLDSYIEESSPPSVNSGYSQLARPERLPEPDQVVEKIAIRSEPETKSTSLTWGIVAAGGILFLTSMLALLTVTNRDLLIQTLSPSVSLPTPTPLSPPYDPTVATEKSDLDFAISYNNFGIEYYDRGRYDEAIENFNQALRFKPDFIESYYNRGLVYFDKRDYDAALADYNKVIQLNSGYAAAYFGRALVYQVKRDPEKAIADYEVFIVLTDDPDLRLYAEEQLRILQQER